MTKKEERKGKKKSIKDITKEAFKMCMWEPLIIWFTINVQVSEFWPWFCS